MMTESASDYLKCGSIPIFHYIESFLKRARKFMIENRILLINGLAQSDTFNPDHFVAILNSNHYDKQSVKIQHACFSISNYLLENDTLANFELQFALSFKSMFDCQR